jgi:hypothetical protein
MTSAEIAAQVAETRARQGLPPTITDPTVLTQLAVLVADTWRDMAADGRADEGEGGADHARPA